MIGLIILKQKHQVLESIYIFSLSLIYILYFKRRIRDQQANANRSTITVCCLVFFFVRNCRFVFRLHQHQIVYHLQQKLQL